MSPTTTALVTLVAISAPLWPVLLYLWRVGLFRRR